MNTKSTIDANSEIVSEACAWFAQLESGDMSGADLAALREWMNRSPAHAREIRAIADLSGQLSVLTELAPALEQSAGVGHSLRKPRRTFGSFVPAMAAALTLVVATGVVLSTVFFGGDRGPEIYKTAIGEYQTIKLADGTEVSLNTDSQIEVDFNKEERRVRLINGEVLFDVASNPKRPFVVYSDTAVAEAVGTSFVVRLRNAVTELAVVEGIVAFAKLPDSLDISLPLPAPESQDTVKPEPALIEKVIVKAGQAITSSDLEAEAVLPAAQELSVLTERDLQRRLSWTDGFLEFSETPLEDVIEELTRHNNITVEITDPGLESMRLGGIFRTGDVEQLMGALEGLGIVVERQGTNHYLLQTAESG